MTRFVNNTKTFVLLVGMMGLFLLVGSIYGQNGMLIALVLGGVMNVVAFFFSDKIAIASMRGVEVFADTPGPGGQLYSMVDQLRQRANMPMPRVYICPQDAPNAFATGRSPSKAAVAITEGALRLLTPEEVAGVMAHELAHVKNRDTLTSTVAATIAGVLAYIAQWGMFFGGGNREGGNPLAAIAVFIFAAVGAALLKAMVSRSREYVADHDGAVIAGTPSGLISALQKLEVYSSRIPLHSPNPAQNNMFIVEPLITTRGLLSLFSTHPPVENRIAALRDLER